MAEIFHYGPYAVVSFPPGALAPGAENTEVWGPWPWYADVIGVTAHPIHLAGLDRRLEVTRVWVQVTPAGDRFLHATVKNVGSDAANYAWWIGGIKP